MLVRNGDILFSSREGLNQSTSLQNYRETRGKRREIWKLWSRELITQSFWTFNNWPMHYNGLRFIFYQSFRDMRWTIHSYQQERDLLSILTSFLNILSASELFTIWIGQLPSLRERRNSVTTICNFPCSQNPPFLVAHQYSSPIQGHAMDLDVKDFQI